MPAGDAQPAGPDNGTPRPAVLRSYQLIGRPARDLAGQPLGRVLDLVIEGGPGVPATVTAALVSGGPWGRLLGYESPDERGPWLLTTLARWIIRRQIRTVAWDELRIDPPE